MIFGVLWSPRSARERAADKEFKETQRAKKRLAKQQGSYGASTACGLYYLIVWPVIIVVTALVWLAVRAWRGARWIVRRVRAWWSS